MALILHQFPISHYCEKVRWALDYKGLDYQLKNYLPGTHTKKMKAMGSDTSVPVLEHDGYSVQGSAQIINYLEEQFPEQALTPQDPQLKAKALEWEAFCDEEIGPHVRRFCYDTLLHHRSLVVPLLSHQGPIWGAPLLHLGFFKLKKLMRGVMRIREPYVSQSRETLEQALDKLQSELADRQYLVGDGFTRADLAAASLLAPLFMPAGYGLDWPERVPEPLNSWIGAHREQLAWPAGLYEAHRQVRRNHPIQAS